MTGTTMTWTDNQLAVRSETQTFNQTSGGMDIEVHGEIAESAEWWFDTAVHVLAMLVGKPNEAGTEYSLGPVGADPDMIGALVASKLREAMPQGKNDN